MLDVKDWLLYILELSSKDLRLGNLQKMSLAITLDEISLTESGTYFLI